MRLSVRCRLSCADCDSSNVWQLQRMSSVTGGPHVVAEMRWNVGSLPGFHGLEHQLSESTFVSELEVIVDRIGDSDRIPSRHCRVRHA